jgi:hypothetical protein
MLLDESRPPIALDLEELMLVDLEAVRSLGRCTRDFLEPRPPAPQDYH